MRVRAAVVVGVSDATVPFVFARRRRATEGREELVPEDLVEYHIEWVVDGRVHRQQHVGDLTHALHQVVVRLDVAEVEEGGHDGVGDDTDEEEDDDNDEHHCDLVARRQLLVGARPAQRVMMKALTKTRMKSGTMERSELWSQL